MRQLRRLQEEIVVILCELEMYFPPAFFDVMVHLQVHIVEDIIQLRSTFLHSMMPFERMTGVDTSPSYLLFQTLLPLFGTLTCMI